MESQQLNSGVSANGVNAAGKRSRKGIKRQWKDLPPDPLALGFDNYPASYIVGKSSITWADLNVGSIFSRSKSGKSLHMKIDAGRAICMDTGDSLEIAPKLRMGLQVWKVTSFNSTTA